MGQKRTPSLCPHTPSSLHLGAALSEPASPATAIWKAFRRTHFYSWLNQSRARLTLPSRPLWNMGMVPAESSQPANVSMTRINRAADRSWKAPSTTPKNSSGLGQRNSPLNAVHPEPEFDWQAELARTRISGDQHRTVGARISSLSSCPLLTKRAASLQTHGHGFSANLLHQTG